MLNFKSNPLNPVYQATYEVVAPEGICKYSHKIIKTGTKLFIQGHSDYHVQIRNPQNDVVETEETLDHFLDLDLKPKSILEISLYAEPGINPLTIEREASIYFNTLGHLRGPDNVYKLLEWINRPGPGESLSLMKEEKRRSFSFLGISLL